MENFKTKFRPYSLGDEEKNLAFRFPLMYDAFDETCTEAKDKKHGTKFRIGKSEKFLTEKNVLGYTKPSKRLEKHLGESRKDF